MAGRIRPGYPAATIRIPKAIPMFYRHILVLVAALAVGACGKGADAEKKAAAPAAQPLLIAAEDVVTV